MNKELIEKVNPNNDTYDPRYSEGTYKFLKKYQNRDIRVFWRRNCYVNGKILDYHDDFSPAQVYFLFKSDCNWLGTTWTNIMWNKYQIADYSDFQDELEDITDWFMEKYIKIGRCIFDYTHINFMLGKDGNYVTDEERFVIEDGTKKCRWCGDQA